MKDLAAEPSRALLPTGHGQPQTADHWLTKGDRSQPSVAREPISRADPEAEPSAAWRPTHVHADGGLYRFLRHCDGRADNHEPWLTGALYEGADGRLWWTGNDRWFDRFAPLSSDHSAADGEAVVPRHSSLPPADPIPPHSNMEQEP